MIFVKLTANNGKPFILNAENIIGVVEHEDDEVSINMRGNEVYFAHGITMDDLIDAIEKSQRDMLCGADFPQTVGGIT